MDFFQLPFEPVVFGYTLPIHLIFEYAAFFIAFRFYLFLRKRQGDTITSGNRLSIILGCIAGAYLGSRISAWLEHPLLPATQEMLVTFLNNKSITGGLLGGLIGVEWMKKRIGEQKSSGDLFTFPIILGLIIGRMGCFLSGMNEFVYGVPTTFFTSMNLGDGIPRHPLALYEMLFLVLLFMILWRNRKKLKPGNGDIFRWFMISYFTFRFLIEFLKPNIFLIFGLSGIQYLCLTCLIYYRKTLLKGIKYAGKTLHVL